MNRLKEALNKIRSSSIGCFPTPLHPLKRFENSLSYQDIYIKRDDLNGIGLGGNKIRSLEFLLGQAIENNCDTVIVYGPLQSNLCTLAACACAKLNIKCICIHNAEEPTHFEGNLLLNKLVNVESIFLGNVSAEERNQYAVELSEKLKSQGKQPYIILNGATSGMGALGYTNACLEIYTQVKEQNLPIKTIFISGGNGGVAAGLVYGNYLLGQPFKVVVISVEDDVPTLRTNIKRTILESAQILGLPFDSSVEDCCLITDEYRGSGWGNNTVESEAFVHRLPQLEGIFIENVYTSKVLVGMEDLINKQKVTGGVCYIHTGGLGSLFSQY